MKKLLFSLGLLISGVIGFVGWSIAVTQIVQPGARSTVLGCFYDTDWIVLALFTAMIVAGLVLSVKESKKA